MQKVCDRLEAFGLSPALRSMHSAPYLESLGLRSSGTWAFCSANALRGSCCSGIEQLCWLRGGITDRERTQNCYKRLCAKASLIMGHGSYCAQHVKFAAAPSRLCGRQMLNPHPEVLACLITSDTYSSPSQTHELSLTLEPLLQTTSQHFVHAPNVRARGKGASFSMASGSTRTLPRRRCWLLGLSAAKPQVMAKSLTASICWPVRQVLEIPKSAQASWAWKAGARWPGISECRPTSHPVRGALSSRSHVGWGGCLKHDTNCQTPAILVTASQACWVRGG